MSAAPARPLTTPTRPGTSKLVQSERLERKEAWAACTLHTTWPSTGTLDRLGEWTGVHGRAYESNVSQWRLDRSVTHGGSPSFWWSHGGNVTSTTPHRATRPDLCTRMLRKENFNRDVAAPMASWA